MYVDLIIVCPPQAVVSWSSALRAHDDHASQVGVDEHNDSLDDNSDHMGNIGFCFLCLTAVGDEGDIVSARLLC